MLKRLFIIILIVFNPFSEQQNAMDAAVNLSSTSLYADVAKNKKLPTGFELQALEALSYYPQLKDIKIEFVFTKAGPPLQARPTVWSTLTRSAPNRVYQVRIATEAGPMLSPILLHNMPKEAQVGVLGHELAHIADFSRRSFWGMLEVLLGNLSPSYLDRMEYCTDNRAIEHGMGHQLWAWSNYVHEVFKEYFENKGDKASIFLKKIMENERYMRPETISKRMQELGYTDLP